MTSDVNLSYALMYRCLGHISNESVFDWPSLFLALWYWLIFFSASTTSCSMTEFVGLRKRKNLNFPMMRKFWFHTQRPTIVHGFENKANFEGNMCAHWSIIIFSFASPTITFECHYCNIDSTLLMMWLSIKYYVCSNTTLPISTTYLNSKRSNENDYFT